MKYDLSNLDLESFMVSSRDFHGETLHLIGPNRNGAKWTKDNLFLRSCVVNDNGDIVSLGFKKFFNFGEKPDLSPVPTNLKNTYIKEKFDGSLLIISKYKGKFILRTRGTIDAYAMKNGYELNILKSKHPKLFEFQPFFESWPFSILIEWCSPINQIVCKFDEPIFYLLGIIFHDSLVYWEDEQLKANAKYWEMPMPKEYTFNDIETMIGDVFKWEKKEGIVLYSNEGQTMHKSKSDWYNTLHRMKSELGSFDKVMDFYVNANCPDYLTVYQIVLDTFDFELAEQVKGSLSKLVDAKKEVDKIISGMKEFVFKLQVLSIRRLQAEKILSSYGQTNRAGYCFKLLDGKTLDNDDIKKLLYQCLKSS